MISASSLYKFGSIIAAHLCLLTLFQPFTIVLFWISAFLIYSYFKARAKRLLRDGLIVYLPQKIQQGLMERSLFDVLCDIWFMPGTMNFLKVLTKPFFTSVRPDQAALVLNDLSPEVRKQFLTKGIVNIFPQNLRGVIVSEQRLEGNKKQLPSIQNSQPRPEIVSPLKEKQSLMRETTSDTLNNRRKGDKLRLVMNKEFQDEKLLSSSSPSGGNAQEQHRFQQHHHKWDKLQIYQNIKERLNSGESLIQIIKSNLGIVKNIIQLQSTLVTNISTWKVTKVFLLFLVMLVFQMKMTNQNRKMIVNVIRATIGLTTVFGLVGSTGLLIYKLGYAKKRGSPALKEK